jgi:hypothetical protein
MEYSLKPNLKKVFFSNFLKVFFIALLIIGTVFLMKYIIGLEIYITALDALNLKINTSQILLSFIICVISLAILLPLVNLFWIKGTKYLFYDNKVLINRYAFNKLINSKKIFYQNVFRITHNKDGIFNNIFNCGNIILELNDQKNIKLEFIDNPLQRSNYVQGLLNRFRKIQQANFTEQRRKQKL